MNDILFSESGITRLCGFPGNVENRPYGLFSCRVDGCDKAWGLTQFETDKGYAQFTWQTGDMLVESSFQLDSETGVWRRTDCLKNTGRTSHTIQKCLARFVLEGNTFELFSQFSGWQTENKGAWCSLPSGTATVTNRGIRSCEEATPFAALRDTNTGRSLVFHLMPVGKWILRFSNCIDRCGNAFVVMEAGLSDEGLAMEIEAGEKLLLPELLFYGCEDTIENEAHRFHRYLLKNEFHFHPIPMIYNTWLNDFDRLELSELRRQLAAAKKVGCEVFVVDAGWFSNVTDWWNGVGDWEEKQNGALCGGLMAFSQEVKENGLQFGLWMEPERVGPDTPLAKEHPDWMFPIDEGFFLLNLTNPQAYDYMMGEAIRLIKTYGVDFIKLDFNVGVQKDPSGNNFYRYYKALFHFIDELKGRFPHVILECCSSGGQRNDLSMLRHFDFCVLSDNVNVKDVLHLNVGAYLRLPPGVIGKWLPVRECAPFARIYEEDKAQPRLVACGDATWETVFGVKIDNAVLATIIGPWGITADVSSITGERLAQLKKWVEFYKSHREMLIHCVMRPLTPMLKFGDVTHPIIWQFEALDKKTILILAFRQEAAGTYELIRPVGLQPKGLYVLKAEHLEETKTGEAIMQEGILLQLNHKNSAALVELIRLEG